MELVDPRGTSQECSQCGAVVRKTLSERVHWCTNCGLPADRDFNASLNILRRVGWDASELENARRVETSAVSTRTRQASALKQDAHTLQGWEYVMTRNALITSDHHILIYPGFRRVSAVLSHAHATS